ncbi:MAG: right-handed parallel beta-helix repeat-containing protein [Planctomycetota bacterium]
MFQISHIAEAGTFYYVRTDGNDLNAGTSNTPSGAWLTIQKAADTMVAGDMVFVQAGTYYEMVQPLNSGTSGNPITYKAEGTVVIDGENIRNAAFELIGDDYIVIDGFEITNCPDGGGFWGSIYLSGDSDYVIIRNNIIHDTGRDGINVGGTSNNALIENNLIYNIDDDGITPAGSGNHTLRNNTIYNCGQWGLESAATSGNLYENNIFWDSIDNTGVATYNYNDYSGGALPGTGNISSDPLFVNAAAGDFHLSHIAAGQGSDSPCIDAGSDTAANLGYDTKTTRTDSVSDSGTVDMGYHYSNGDLDQIHYRWRNDDGAETPDWWDTNYPYRMKVTFGTSHSILPAGFTTSVTMDTRPTATNVALTSGDDVRVVWQPISGPDVELDRIGDTWNNASTTIEFRLQSDIPADADEDTDGSYYIYYGFASAGTPPSDEMNVYYFADFFTRSDSTTVGNGWTEWTQGGDMSIW